MMNSTQKADTHVSIRLLIIYLISSVLFSCNKKGEETQPSLVLKDSLSLNPGFAIQEKLFGFCYSKLGEKHLYFANTTGENLVKIFDLDGKLKKTIQLDSILKFEPYLEDIEIISLDTIVAISQYSNKIYLLSDSGQVIRKIEMNPLLGFPENNSRHLFTSNSSNTLIDDKTLLFPMYANVDNPEQWLEDRMGLVRHLCINNWKNDQFLLVKQLSKDSIKLITGFKLYQHISPNDSLKHFINDFKSFSVGNKFIYAYSLYSNLVFLLNKDNLALVDTISVKSNKTTIGAKHIDYSELKIGEAGMEQHYNFETSGTISSLHFNKTRNHLFALVSKANEKGFYMREGYGLWMLIIYDSEYNKILEFEFSGKNYEPFVIPFKDGFYLRKKIKTSYPEFPVKLHYYEYD